MSHNKNITQFIHHDERHLNYIYFVAIMDKSSMNIQLFYGHMHSFFLGISIKRINEF
jgi:hypothetical protein